MDAVVHRWVTGWVGVMFFKLASLFFGRAARPVACVTLAQADVRSLSIGSDETALPSKRCHVLANETVYWESRYIHQSFWQVRAIKQANRITVTWMDGRSGQAQSLAHCIHPSIRSVIWLLE